MLYFFKNNIENSDKFTPDERNTVISTLTSEMMYRALRLLKYCEVLFGTSDNSSFRRLFYISDEFKKPNIFEVSSKSSNEDNIKNISINLIYLYGTSMDRIHLPFNMFNRTDILNPTPNSIVDYECRPLFYPVVSGYSDYSVLRQLIDSCSTFRTAVYYGPKFEVMIGEDIGNNDYTGIRPFGDSGNLTPINTREKRITSKPTRII